jgi:hypothetical protein
LNHWSACYDNEADGGSNNHTASQNAALQQPRGRKPSHPWKDIKNKCFELMSFYGEFSNDDPDWNCQARLEESLKDFCMQTYDDEPTDSAFRQKIPSWLKEWRNEKSQQNQRCQNSHK